MGYWEGHNDNEGSLEVWGQCYPTSAYKLEEQKGREA